MTDIEKKQVLATLATIRTETNSIGKILSSMISLVGSLRAAELGITLVIEEIEAKLSK